MGELKEKDNGGTEEGRREGGREGGELKEKGNVGTEEGRREGRREGER